MDMPAFNKASVDGFACRKSEIYNELEIIETIPAGRNPEKTLGKDQCSRIMTGAVVPEGACCVIMVEDTEILPSGRVRFKGSFNKENIAFKGEDVRKGDMLLGPGRLIKPQDIAVLASAGKTSVAVSKMPAIAVISTGNEIVEPFMMPTESQVRNVNAYQLLAQVERAGAAGRYYGIAKDDEEETFKIIEKAISENDLVLITGGVSMGDFDFVPSVLERALVRLLFTRVAVQPGKPTTFGIHEKAIVFGLPGNPVSSFMMFEMLVRPLIYGMMGYPWRPSTAMYPVRNEYKRRSAERMALVPVIITADGLASTVEYHGSAHITALPDAEGIITVPLGVKTIEKGTLVSVRQI
jgi:molybdopterin molybdotransferase